MGIPNILPNEQHQYSEKCKTEQKKKTRGQDEPGSETRRFKQRSIFSSSVPYMVPITKVLILSTSKLEKQRFILGIGDGSQGSTHRNFPGRHQGGGG